MMTTAVKAFVFVEQQNLLGVVLKRLTWKAEKFKLDGVAGEVADLKLCLLKCYQSVASNSCI